MRQNVSQLHMQLAPIPTFPRKQGKELFIPSSACGGQGNTCSAAGLGWGRNRTPDILGSAPVLALSHLQRKWGLHADEVIK